MNSPTLPPAIADAAAAEPGRAALIEEYFRHLPQEDLPESADEAGAIVDTHIRLARNRRPGECVVRVFNPRTRSEDAQNVTVVDIVNDDMPHLVEAVVGTLTAAGVRVFRVQHPILVVRRADDGLLQDVIGGAHGPWARGLSGAGEGFVRESWMHVLIDRLADAERAEAIEEQVAAALADVRAIVQDSGAMTAAVHEIADLVSAGAIDGSESGPASPGDAAGPAEVVGGRLDAAEVADLLDWLADDNMVFLGVREEHRTDGERAAEGLGVLRAAGPNSSAVVDLSVTDSDSDATTIAITQAGRASVLNAAATPLCLVLRTPTGDRWRVVGVLQPRAVAADLASVPVLRRTLATVLHELGASAESFTGQRAIDLLSGYPRAELFWADPDQVAALCADVLHGSSRRRLRVYLQHDPRGRFVTALVFLARDRWTTGNRLRMQDVLLETLHGTDIRYGARVGQAELAVAQFVVQTDTDPAQDRVAEEVDLDALTSRLRDVLRSWEDDLLSAVSGTDDVLDTADVLARYSTAFDEAYKENYQAQDAVADLEILDGLEGPDDLALTIAMPAPEDDTDDTDENDAAADGQGRGDLRGAPHARVRVDRRLKLFVAGRAISLSQVFPVLQSMGAEVVDEHPYTVRRSDGTSCRIYDFGLAFGPSDLPDEADQMAARRRFIDAFVAAWRGWSETDGFNRLILGSGLDWRQIAVLRAYSHYLQQIGTPYTQTYIQQVLSQYGTLAADLAELFSTRFDPALDLQDSKRAHREQELTARFDAELDSVASLDADRILRSVRRVILATDRTNAYRAGSEGTLAFKLVPSRIPDVPKPVPAHEIWVYSPSVEGVHLRFGDVARGGLRWSDRPEDFRTEILGLVKAQEVKNAVIVPVGAKGGFVVRRPVPPTGDPQRDREAQQATGIACYQEFIGALLDVTDNRVEGRIVPPDDVVRHDQDDPYLVVAADKGTATFSDIANALAVERGFWLGDAFASGGSAGYDHKGMGITARGAWESVKHHFTDLGLDTQTQEFTVVGVGDMSGDVFGNGMLLSDHIRLVAAFDHRHIFVDPDPDHATGFAERRRLFEKPRSSWADYDTELISAGGGVFPRTAKSIPVSREMRTALGLDDAVAELSPVALIRAILQAPVDLLWNGGIGTYVKASSESQGNVGDKANDPVRVDANQVRARVIGEGGNLGITQLGRIQFAQLGGRINTDAIDNSAGVDTSDHEVNIKIALAPQVAAGRLTLPERNELLASMTDEVAALVLADNIAQNELLGVSRSHAPLMLSVHQRLIRALVSAGSLNRELEFLPSDETIDERIAAGLGLTSPELSVLVAYVKSQAATEILGSGLADDPAFTAGLAGYFPSAMRTDWSQAIQQHPLRREIVTTIAANEVVNGGGISYLFRIQEETAAAITDGVRTYAVTSTVFGLPALWQEISDLSARVPAPAKDALLLSLRRLLDRASRWFLSHRPQPLDVRAETQRYVEAAADLANRMPELLQGVEADNVTRDSEQLVELGAPLELARRVAHSLYSFSLLDIVDVAEATGREPAEAAAVYYALSAHLDFDRLLTAVTELERGDRWHALARQSVRDDLYRSMRLLTADVLSGSTSTQDSSAKIEQWEQENASRLARARITLTEIAGSGQGDLAALSVAAREFRSMVR